MSGAADWPVARSTSSRASTDSDCVVLEVVVGVQQADDRAAVGGGEEDEHARHDQHEAAVAVGQARERVEHQLALKASCQAATTGLSPAIAPRSIAVTMFRCIPWRRSARSRRAARRTARDTTLMTSPYLRAHVVADLRVRDRDVALHQHEQRVPVGQQLGRRMPRPSRPASRPGSASAAARRNDVDDLLAGAVVAGEEELLLRAEEAEQVGLRDAGVAGDRLGRRAVVAAARRSARSRPRGSPRGVPRRTCGVWERRPCAVG